MNKREIINSLKEMREASAACFRVIYIGKMVDELESELKRIGIEEGFGLRCQELIKKLEKEK